MQLGERLREERERLGYNQADFAALAGATRKTQFNYETGERSPDANYLLAIGAAGADVQYIVMGMRSAQALSRDEIELLEAFRAAPLVVKGAVIGALQGGNEKSAAEKKQKQVVRGSANQVAGGDITNSQGVSFNAPTGKRKR